MEYLQYSIVITDYDSNDWCFKPCYKWNTFNTQDKVLFFGTLNEVLNLVINGIPSILLNFKWGEPGEKVLNLVINGIPSIHRVLNCFIDTR